MRNKIINNQIESLKNNIQHSEVMLEFAEKKEDQNDVDRYKARIKEAEDDIEIWESLKE